MFDKSRGGDETRHKYLTHSEWHTDSKFVGLLKVGYQTSILEIKSKIKVDGSMRGIALPLCVGEGSVELYWWERNASSNQPHTLSDTLYSKELLYCLL